MRPGNAPGPEGAAARLIERIVSDSQFRARFRRDPVAAAREMGVEPPSETATAPALETLEMRESKSSLAGALTAAAVEGFAMYDFADHLVSGHDPASAALSAFGPEEAQAAAPPPAPTPAVALEPAAAPGPPATAAPAPAPEVSAAHPGAEVATAGADPDDEDEPDEEEPDEEEPDEEEPDEVGPDQDDLTDDEVVPDGEQPDEPQSGEDTDGGDQDDSDGGSDADQDDSDGGSDADQDDSDGGSDSGDEDDASDADAAGDAEDIAATYPGDDAKSEQIAAWMAVNAEQRGLPRELPVMAALVESGLRNLPGGHADSVGYFQMRLGIWNSGDYAGYPDQPERQLDWFLDHAEAVRSQRVARGQSVSDPAQYGEWIADVERPAEEYRGRYQLRLDEARELLRGSRPPDGADKAGPSAGDVADAVGGGGGTRAGARAREALAEARKELGTAYRWGGSTPETGFDCSGLVQWAYAKAGIRIPRVTDQQILADGATKVDWAHLLPGDLVFFRDATGYVHHVGISLGGKKFIHSPRTGDVVKVSSLDEPYFAQQFTGGRRFDEAVTGSPAHTKPTAGSSDVGQAREASLRDAVEANRPGTALYAALTRQEAANENMTRVMPAITRNQVVRRS